MKIINERITNERGIVEYFNIQHKAYPGNYLAWSIFNFLLRLIQNFRLAEEKNPRSLLIFNFLISLVNLKS